MKRGDRRADSGHPSAAEIEREISRTRAELGRTVDALERRLAPHSILGEGIDMITEYVGRKKALAGDLGEAVRANRVPLALIAAGVGWLVASNTRIGRGARDRPAAPVTAQGAIPAARDTERAGGRLLHSLERYPLLVGLAGIVTGAVAAALLPPTKREQEWVDKARGELWKKAEDIGHDAAGRVRNLAECPAQAATEPAPEPRPQAL